MAKLNWLHTVILGIIIFVHEGVSFEANYDKAPLLSDSNKSMTLDDGFSSNYSANSHPKTPLACFSSAQRQSSQTQENSLLLRETLREIGFFADINSRWSRTSLQKMSNKLKRCAILCKDCQLPAEELFSFVDKVFASQHDRRSEVVPYVINFFNRLKESKDLDLKEIRLLLLGFVGGNQQPQVLALAAELIDLNRKEIAAHYLLLYGYEAELCSEDPTHYYTMASQAGSSVAKLKLVNHKSNQEIYEDIFKPVKRSSSSKQDSSKGKEKEGSSKKSSKSSESSSSQSSPSRKPVEKDKTR